MNWFSLIPTALSALGGIFSKPSDGATTTTTTSTPALSPAMQAAAGAALGKANDIWQKPYQAYTGERVAGPSAQRPKLDSMMSSLGTQINNGMADSNGFQARIAALMGRGPQRVTAPNMVNGGPQGGLTQAPMPVAPLPQSPTGV